MAVRQAILLATFILFVCGDVPYCRNEIPLNQSNMDPVYGWESIAECRLHQYRSQDVVHCLDKMSSKINKKFHILVIGDSRMRQQFFELLSLIPNYDIEWSNFTRLRWAIHHDMDADSYINNVRISFRWRPLIDGTLVDEMSQWTGDRLDSAPDFILFGSSVHHMIQVIQDNQQWYEQQLEQIAPVISKLAQRTRVVWWTQNSIIESYTETKEFGNDITIQKLIGYERSAHRILRNTGVEIWDSGLRMAEEYIRGCVLHKRRDISKSRDCYDSVHTGHVALFRGSQFLFNSLCNSFLFT